MLVVNLKIGKWLKLVTYIALTLAISTSSVFITIHILNKKSESPIQESLFVKTVELIKQQAKLANSAIDYSKKYQAIDNVGKSLMDLMISDDAELLTDETFETNYFYVKFDVFSLNKSEYIRRVEFTIKNNSNHDPSDERRYFLQYVGASSFFSNICYLDSTDKDFTVFNNNDGCFAITLSESEDYSNSSSFIKYKYYHTKVLSLNRDNFNEEQLVEVPMKIPEEVKLSFVRDNETLKLAQSDGDYSGFDGIPEFIFNSRDISFNIPKLTIQSNPVNYDIPGMLLGLSDLVGNLRTLFIYQSDKRIECKEFTKQIIFPRNSKLFSLMSYKLQKDYSDSTTGYEDDITIESFDISKILCAPLGVDKKSDLDRIFSARPGVRTFHLTDIPLYIDSDYVCYTQNFGVASGGTYNWSDTKVRFDKLDNLSKFKPDSGSEDDLAYSLVPEFVETNLFELAYGSKANLIYKGFDKSDIQTSFYHPFSFVNLTQLALMRNAGRWSLMLPVFHEYHHPGNGSYHNYIEDFSTYSDDTSLFLQKINNSANIYNGWPNWDAKDWINFPNSKVYIRQLEYCLSLGRQDNDFIDGYESDLKIPISPDEYIVSINFSDSKKTTDNWLSELESTFIRKS